MVYGLDKMVYALPWLDKTAIKLGVIKWSTGCLRLIKRPLALVKRSTGEAIKWFTGDKVVYGLPSPR